MQEDYELEISRGYIVRFCLKQKKENKTATKISVLCLLHVNNLPVKQACTNCFPLPHFFPSTCQLNCLVFAPVIKDKTGIQFQSSENPVCSAPGLRLKESSGKTFP
jgi:hypothetical protein